MNSYCAGFYNPAVALAGAVVGDIGWKRMLVCISAEMLGGFLAAILVWFTYIPHFQPLEVVQQTDDNLCNCCDLETGGVAIIKQELSAPAHRYSTRHQLTTSKFLSYTHSCCRSPSRHSESVILLPSQILNNGN
jgi:glycerol uptake facilitator-like aquaporin